MWDYHRRVTNCLKRACDAKRFQPKIEHLVDAEVALRRSPSGSNLRGGGNSVYRPTQCSVPEDTITLIAFQFAAFTLIAAYLAFSVATLHRRNQVSWESLSSRLDPAWSLAGSAGVAVLASDRSVRWSAFRNAGVLMQMADYADRNGTAIDPSVLSSLRADAIRMRIAVLQSLVRRSRVL